MKRSLISHGTWGLVALSAFALGWHRGGFGTGTHQDDQGHGNRSALRLGDGSDGRLTALPGTPGKDASLANSDAEFAPDGLVVALSEQRIAELGAIALKDPNPLNRRLAFNELLKGMTVENAMLIREQIKGLRQDSSEFRDFHYAWGSIAGSEAVLNGMSSGEHDMAVTLAGWAAADAGAAMAWFGEMAEQKKANDELKSGLVHGLADTDPDAAAKFVFDLASAGDNNAEGLLSIVTGEMLRMNGPSEASGWAENLPEGPLRAAAMDHVANRFVAEDPVAAAAWAQRFAGDPASARVIEEVGDEWAERDPAAAVSWLETLDSGEGKRWGISSAFGEWVQRDPRAASEHLIAMNDSPERDSAISGFAGRLAYEDPQSAITWAGEISDPGAREQTLIRAGQAMFRRDASSTREWLANSGLSADAQKQVLNPPQRRR